MINELLRGDAVVIGIERVRTVSGGLRAGSEERLPRPSRQGLSRGRDGRTKSR